ncbi:MAG: hypothetical protein KBT28_03920 [Bacteroidales bacterium]|nr:hypothetical protein [Candidatus Colimorpha merdihippi]
MKRLLAIVIWVLLAAAVWAQSPVGQWRDVNSFVSVHGVQSVGNQVFASTRMAMFRYDCDAYTATAITKKQGLSDVGVSTFAYDERSRCMVVAYTNSGFDIKIGDEVYNVADIKYSNISGDKQIYHVRFDRNKAYLATGFGIVVVDLYRHEIEETYYIGTNGTNCAVYDVAFTDSLIVSATDNGLMTAPRYSNRLHIYTEWTRDTLSPLYGMSVRMLGVSDNNIVAASCTDNSDSMTLFFQKTDGSWENTLPQQILSLRCHDGKIVVCCFDHVNVYDGRSHALLHDIDQLAGYNVMVWDADIDADQTLWMGHAWAGLLRVPYPYTAAFSHYPEGPSTDDYVYSITTSDNTVYLCRGGKKPTYESAYMMPNVSYKKDNQWMQLDFSDIEAMDALNVAVDPLNNRHVSVTLWGHGVADFYDGALQSYFHQGNTPQLPAYRDGDFVHLRTAGLAYDGQGNLWVTNSLVNEGLAVRYKDGSWESFNISPLLSGLANEKREIDKVVWDSLYDYKWVLGRANRIYVLDGKGKMAYVNPNNGSKLETHSVNCLVQDRMGDMWIGTDKGIKVIYDGYRAFSNGGRGEVSPVSCSNILYSDDGIYEYLMAYESITCIAVDGGNRKWVGTSNNGVYLVSANGLVQLEHFTTANSPLNSDKVVALSVHPVTGEVFIGTNMGVQAYRASATGADEYPSEDIHAFPNPVRPDYQGVIAIKGFTRDALVHITDARGHVVYSTTANGGQAIWNGCNLSGQRVASGAYFVFASDHQGQMRSVTKILVVK